MSSTWTLPDDLVVPERAVGVPRAGESLPQHWSKCFGCGDDQPSGMSMRFAAGEGIEVSGRLEVATPYQGGPGVIHGGILSTAFDEAQGMACLAVDKRVVTGHLEIDFARPIPLDSVLEIRARVDGTVRRKVYTSAEAVIVDGPGADPGVIVGTSRALFLTITDEHFAKVQAVVDGTSSTRDGASSI